jgi:hypothetical protein
MAGPAPGGLRVWRLHRRRVVRERRGATLARQRWHELEPSTARDRKTAAAHRNLPSEVYKFIADANSDALSLLSQEVLAMGKDE